MFDEAVFVGSFTKAGGRLISFINLIKYAAAESHYPAARVAYWECDSVSESVVAASVARFHGKPGPLDFLRRISLCREGAHGVIPRVRRVADAPCSDGV